MGTNAMTNFSLIEAHTTNTPGASLRINQLVQIFDVLLHAA